MRIFGNCGQCGRPIEESKKTCGANFVICNKCKMMIHVHCIGEHRLRHKNLENQLKGNKNTENESIISKILIPIKRIFSSSKT